MRYQLLKATAQDRCIVFIRRQLHKVNITSSESSVSMHRMFVVQTTWPTRRLLHNCHRSRSSRSDSRRRLRHSSRRSGASLSSGACLHSGEGSNHKFCALLLIP